MPVGACRPLCPIQCCPYSAPVTYLHAVLFVRRLLLIAYAQHTERIQSVESMMLIHLAAVDHVRLVNVKGNLQFGAQSHWPCFQHSVITEGW